MPYKDPEKAKIYAHAHYLANIEAYKKSSRISASKPLQIAKKKIYGSKHQIENNKAARRYRKNHPDRRKKTLRASAKKHAESGIIRTNRYRALKRSAQRHDLSAAQWREIKAAHGYKCAYCGKKLKKLTQDHITPISKGGEHSASNVIPACQACNSRKNDRAPLIAVQPLLLTVAKPYRARQRRLPQIPTTS